MKPDTRSPLVIPRDRIRDDGISLPFVRKGWECEAMVYTFKGAIHAFVNRCPHLPLTLDIGSGEFFTGRGNELLCANHGARFDPETGVCTWGPCVGHALTPIPFQLAPDGSHVLLDLNEVDKDRPSRAEIMGEK